MRTFILLGLACFTGGCMCSRHPAIDQATAARPPAVLADGQQVQPFASNAAARAQLETANALSDAVATTHAYLRAASTHDWAKANTYWVGGKPPSWPGDNLLHGMDKDLRALRASNGAASALDKESPPRAIEVPVELRITQAATTSKWKGVYRLHRKVDGSGWEITSAELYPTLD